MDNHLNLYYPNMRKMALHAFFHSFRAYLPLYYIFFSENGLGFTEITFLASGLYAATFLFEIPSGIFSDKHGRKASIVLASFFSLVSYVFYIYGSGFFHFLMACIFFGIGEAFISGSDEAIIYDSLKCDGREREFRKHYGRKYAFLNYGFGIGSLVASLIIVSDIRVLFVVSAMAECVALLIALTIREPPIYRKQGDYLGHLKDAARFAYHEPVILRLIIFFAAITAGSQIFFRFMQFFILDAGIARVNFGYLYAFFIVFSGFASMISHRFEKSLNLRVSALFIVGLLVLSFAGLGLSSSLFGVFLFISGIEFAFGFYAPVLNHFFHDLTESSHRATVSSLKSFVGGISIAVFAPVFGLVADVFSYPNSMILLSLVFLVVSVFSVWGLVQDSR